MSDNDNQIDIGKLSFTDMERLIELHGSQRKAAKALGVAKSTFNDRYSELQQGIFREAKLLNPIQLKPNGKVRRWIFTAAQDETLPFYPFFNNLKAYAEHLGAELHISGFTYNKRLFENHDKYNGWYHRDLKPYMANGGQERLEIGSDLVYCGEMNTLPTAVRPLSGFERYTGSKWGIFPHAKFHLRSLGTQKFEPSKVIMTTGAVTKPNYIAKKAGIKAEYDHIYGAVLVELESSGEMFIRHLHGSKDDGSFHDLDVLVKNGKVKKGQRVEAINWPDIHTEKMDWFYASQCWGPWNGSTMMDEPMVDVLRPKYQFFHDVSDFMSRSYHNVDDPHFMYEMFIHGTESVQHNITQTADFLQTVHRPFADSIIVESNHDLHFEKWLKTADYRKDPVNAEFFLECQLAKYRAVREGNKRFSILEHVVSNLNPNSKRTRWLSEDETFRICGDHEYGIECGMHGHLGIDGARGNPMALAKMGPRINIGHGHAALVADGMYRSGVFQLDMSYNRGPSSWNRSLIVTHKTGRRQIVFLNDSGRWRSQH